MIYCNVMGGLGNIMFQVSATFSFSIDKNIDCSFPNIESHFNYLNGESLFNPKLKHSHEYNIFFSKIKKNIPQTSLPVIHFPFEYCDIKLPEDNFFVHGFFQSEKYFLKHRNEILNLFEVNDSIYTTLKEKYSFINNLTSTSIHVRRGDYVQFPNLHPTLPIEYYKNAIEELKPQTDVFIIFSDDIDWCKNIFIGDNFFFVEKEKDYLEVILMSMCNNNIIANSSFSWWGAWLNDDTNKKVIGPNTWFGPGITHKTDDIIPESWMKL